MAVTSGLFNSKNGDRKYDAVWFAKYFSTFIGNGVFPKPSTGLQILDNENMTTICKPGDGWINGYFVNNDSDLVLYHDVADGILDRIDRIVMQLNYLDRQIYIKIKKGVGSATPVAPEVVRNLEVHELVLADVYIAAGTTVIDQSNIVDERLNSELCGIVHGVVDQVDTTTIGEQYRGWYTTFTAKSVKEMDEFMNEKEQEIQDFVDDLNEILAGDVAANLLSSVVNLETRTTSLETQIVNKLDVTGTAASATKLVTPRLFDGILFDGQQQVKRFATCSTEPEVQNKLVTVTNVDLVSGTVIIVKFTKGNTHAQPKIDLRRGSVSEGIKDIMRNDGKPFTKIFAGGVYTFVYDGTAFILQGESGVSRETVNTLTLQYPYMASKDMGLNFYQCTGGAFGDGTFYATYSSDDSSFFIHLWDSSTGTRLLQIKSIMSRPGQSYPHTSGPILPDGRRVIGSYIPYFISADLTKMDILKSITYSGTLQRIMLSKDKESIILFYINGTIKSYNFVTDVEKTHTSFTVGSFTPGMPASDVYFDSITLDDGSDLMLIGDQSRMLCLTNDTSLDNLVIFNTAISHGSVNIIDQNRYITFNGTQVAVRSMVDGSIITSSGLNPVWGVNPSQIYDRDVDKFYMVFNETPPCRVLQIDYTNGTVVNLGPIAPSNMSWPFTIRDSKFGYYVASYSTAKIAKYTNKIMEE